MKKLLMLVLIPMVALVSSCGGGDSSPSSSGSGSSGSVSPVSGPVGVWIGTESGSANDNGRMLLVVLPTLKTYRFLFNTETSPFGLAVGVIATVAPGAFQSGAGDTYQFNLQHINLPSYRETGTYVTGSSISGSLVITDSSIYYSTYNGVSAAGYSGTPQLSSIVGSYVGAFNKVSLPLTISASGSVTLNSSGCQVTGSVSPRSDGLAVFDVSLFVTGISCPSGPTANGRYAGIAVLDATGATPTLLVGANGVDNPGVFFVYGGIRG